MRQLNTNTDSSLIQIMDQLQNLFQDATSHTHKHKRSDNIFIFSQSPFPNLGILFIRS